MKRIVSISLGSSSRDHRAEMDLEGEKFIVERIGTDGDLALAAKKYQELDGQVDVLCMGGTDLYFYLENRRYPVRDAFRLVKGVSKTPIADGSKLKVSLEYATVKKLAQMEIIKPGMKTLMISAVDRFGMAKALEEVGCQLIFGDFYFALGLPIPLHSTKSVKILAKILLPVLCKLPFKFLYPIGKKQEENRPRFVHLFNWAELIAGDFNYIARYMPSDLQGKIVLTNTVTERDVQKLKERGVKTLVTTTPELSGRSFGTNVIEGILVCVLSKNPEEISGTEALSCLEKLGFQPRIEHLN